MLSSASKIVIFILFLSFAHSYAQQDTLFANVGEHACKNVVLAENVDDNLLEGQISGRIFLKNPTMFYPDSIGSTANTLLFNKKMQRLSDSVYSFTANYSIDNIAKTLEITVCGLALAGNDSICVITIDKIHVGTSELEAVNFYLSLNSVGAGLPYIRIPIFSNAWPNPARIHYPVEWEYRIDYDQKIVFKIYDFEGKLISEFDQGIVERGIRKFSFTPSYYFSSGIYFIVLESDRFNLMKKFIIVK